jgi:hypothetical protein
MARWMSLSILGLLLSANCFAEAAPATNEIPEHKFQFEEMSEACAKTDKRDKICDVLVQVRNVGKDALEFAKETLDLTPTQYTLLTIGNSLATGRFRIRTNAYFIPDTALTLDFQRSETSFLLEKSF